MYVSQDLRHVKENLANFDKVCCLKYIYKKIYVRNLHSSRIKWELYSKFVNGIT